MNRPRVGVRLESLGLPLRRALAEAARLGVLGVQIDAVGDLSPLSLSLTGRREFRNLLKAHNLELTAVGCPLRRGLDSPADQQPRLEYVRKVLSLSFDLGPRITVVQAGAMPKEPDAPEGRLMAEALENLGRFGDRVGATLAVETGLESGADLAAYLARFESGSLRANLDPANLMLHGFDPYDAVRALGHRIVHTHARDCRIARASGTASEVPVGRGDLDWLRYLSALEEIEYRGWLTIEREQGNDRLADITEGVAFLRRFIIT
jgi:sugar phosphate isomerase/epimerase